MHDTPLDGRQHSALAQMIPLVILATLAVIGRFSSRRLMRAQIGADDYTIIVGLVLTYGTFVNAICRKLMERSGSRT